MVTRLRTAARGERGFTLIEVMVAAGILLAGVLGLLTMVDTFNESTSRTKAREGGVNLAREAIEAARAVPYPSLIPAQVAGELQAQPGLEDAAAAPGWQVQRRGLTYTLTVGVCSVDDGNLATDGFGDHDGGFFCADSTTEGTTDTNPDDYKRVTIDVSWEDDGDRTFSARQEGVINNPGSAFAPAIKTLTTNPTTLGTVITSPSLSSIAFSATTSSRAEEVKWSLDNLQQGTATASNVGRTAWGFNWDISAWVDGTYLISANAFDQFGESGASRVLTMQLNRFQPSIPTGFVGGRNAAHGPDFVEFEWNPNPERDVVGYRVYRTTASGNQPVCTTSIDDDAAPTTCRDTSAPGAPELLSYYVVALAPARTGSGLEESPVPANADMLQVGAPTPPDPPATVSGTRDFNGTTLTWTASPSTDVRYYRIYRDGVALGDRLDRTGTPEELTFSDPGATAIGRRYWVTAVDDSLAESAMAPSGGIAP